MGVFEDIRARADLLEVVRGRAAELKKKGGGWYALCPFHQENTPSLSVDPEKGLWYCFGCQRGGDVIEFVAEAEGVDRVEAARELAERLGIQWSGRSSEETDRGRELLREAQELFRHYLTETTHGRKYLNYLRDRGIDDALADTFGLGCTPPNSNGLVNTLLERGYSEQELYDFGLTGENQRGVYDFFRDRLTFPLHDTMGKLVGFSGRVIDPEGSPKYLNTRDTPLYKKKRVVYNYHRARKQISRQGAIVVEGFTDVIALHREGIENSVATSGTSFTEHHAQRLARLTGEIYFCFDGDRAGVRAALSASKQCVAVGVLPKIVLLGGDADPDDIVSERGRKAFLELLEETIDPVELMVRSKRGIEDDLERRRELFRECSELHRAADDLILQDELLKRFADELEIPRRKLEEELRPVSDGGNRQRRSGRSRPRRPRASGSGGLTEEIIDGEAELVAHLVHYPETLDGEMESLLDRFELSKEGLKALRVGSESPRELSGWLAEGGAEDRPRFRRKLMRYLTEAGNEEFEAEQRLHRSVQVMAYRLYLGHLKREIDRLQRKLEKLESRGEENEAEQVFQRKQQLQQVRNKLVGTIRDLAKPEAPGASAD